MLRSNSPSCFLVSAAVHRHVKSKKKRWCWLRSTYYINFLSSNDLTPSYKIYRFVVKPICPSVKRFCECKFIPLYSANKFRFVFQSRHVRTSWGAIFTARHAGTAETKLNQKSAWRRGSTRRQRGTM